MHIIKVRMPPTAAGIVNNNQLRDLSLKIRNIPFLPCHRFRVIPCHCAFNLFINDKVHTAWLSSPPCAIATANEEIHCLTHNREIHRGQCPLRGIDTICQITRILTECLPFDGALVFLSEPEPPIPLVLRRLSTIPCRRVIAPRRLEIERCACFLPIREVARLKVVIERTSGREIEREKQQDSERREYRVCEKQLFHLIYLLHLSKDVC